MYYTYILRCEDNTLYTGITTDIERRFNEHISQGEKSAKYTRTHKAVKIEAAWQSDDRITASKLEYHIKKLSRPQKDKLIKNNDFTVFKGKLPADGYKKFKQG